MRAVADGIFEISLGYVHAHLVVVDDGVVLVDTGLPGRTAKIEQALQDVRRSIGEVHTILLTHRHPDHTGGVAELRRRSGARVVAHAADVPVITGAQPQPISGIMRVVAKIMGPAAPVPVDDVVTADGPLTLPGFSVLHTPGHTAGHVSYLLDRSGGVLFAGDAAAGGRGGRVGRTPRIVTDDRDLAAASIRRLAALEFDTAVFGHGPAVTGRAVERFRELATG